MLLIGCTEHHMTVCLVICVHMQNVCYVKSAQVAILT